MYVCIFFSTKKKRLFYSKRSLSFSLIPYTYLMIYSLRNATSDFVIQSDIDKVTSKKEFFFFFLTSINFFSKC